MVLAPEPEQHPWTYSSAAGAQLTTVDTPDHEYILDAPRAVADTSFGTVTDRQVIYFYKKGWLRSGIREDIPIRHITSVRLETSRHPVWGVLLLILGLASFGGGSSGAVILGLVFIAFAALLLWGSPRVVVNTAGGDLRPATGWPWMRPQAEHFVMALRQELFKRL